MSTVSIVRSMALCALIAPLPLGLAEVQLRLVDPTATGPGIRDLIEFPPDQVSPRWTLSDRRHIVAIDPERASANRLFVFLAGSGGLPVFYQRIMEHAASMGYHAVSLAHPNWPAVRDLVASETDPDVAGRIRRERLYGVDEYAGIDVPFADSVQNRLVRLLAYQQFLFPEERWSRFLALNGENSVPAWDRIVVAGHSQGAGYAAFLTRDHLMGGAIMFAGPGDIVNGQQASWLLRPSMTPVERLFGFTHVEDPNAVTFFRNQRTLGLDIFGSIVNVDTGPGGDSAYGGSHMLTTFLEPSTPLDYHGAPVVDSALPLDAGGSPVYAPVWTYMLGSVVPPECPGDANLNRRVEFGDLASVLANLGAITTPYGPGDADGDSAVTFGDAATVLANFGIDCE